MRFGAVAWSLLAASLSMFAADPFAGTWKLTKSSDGVRHVGEILQFRVVACSACKFETLNSGQSPKPMLAELLTDGHRSPYNPVGGEARLIGRPKDRKMVIIYSRNGKDVATLKRRISRDGRRLTESLDGIDSEKKRFHRVDVYEKQ